MLCVPVGAQLWLCCLPASHGELRLSCNAKHTLQAHAQRPQPCVFFRATACWHFFVLLRAGIAVLGCVAAARALPPGGTPRQVPAGQA